MIAIVLSCVILGEDNQSQFGIMRQQIGLLVIFGLASVGIHASIFVCREASECVGGATCRANKCECPAGEIYNSLGKGCLEVASGYGQECEDREQCALLTGSYTCKGGKCACDEGWLYLQGKCIAYKNTDDDCSSDAECFDGVDLFARKCDNDKCKCSDGYYQRRDFDCRKRRSDINEMCSINLDCDFPDGACEDGLCVDTNSPPSIRMDLEQFNNIEDEEEDVETVQRSLGPCDADSDCPLEQTNCNPVVGKCVCNKGYYLREDKCVPELGTECAAPEDCVGFGVSCVNNKCACKDRFQNKKGNMGCLKEPYAKNYWCTVDDSCRIFGSNFACDAQKKCVCMTGYALSTAAICKPSAISGSEMCSSDEDCDAKIKNSKCDPSGACICREEYEYNLDTAQCDALLGGACSLPEDCKIENSVCKTKCTCVDSFVQYGDKQCIPAAPELHEKCHVDVQCAATVTGSYCKDKACECQDDHMELDGKCLRKPTRVNDVCTNRLMCDALGEGLVCRNGFCQCDANRRPSPTGSRCDARDSGAAGGRAWSPAMVGGVAIAYSMIMGVFL